MFAVHSVRSFPTVAVGPTWLPWCASLAIFVSSLEASRLPPWKTRERCTGGPWRTTLPLSSRTVLLGSRRRHVAPIDVLRFASTEPILALSRASFPQHGWGIGSKSLVDGEPACR